MLQKFRRSVFNTGIKKKQTYCHIRIFMYQLQIKAAYRHFHSQLLPAFPYQCLLGGFARFQLTAGKFPKASPGLACRTLADKKLPFPIPDKAGGNLNNICQPVSPR